MGKNLFCRVAICKLIDYNYTCTLENNDKVLVVCIVMFLECLLKHLWNHSVKSV